MAIIKGNAKNAEVVPPAQSSNVSWRKVPSARLQPIKTGDKDKGKENKESFSKKTAKESGAEYTKQKARNAANKQSSYKSPNLLKGVGKFHRGITGSNSAFSRANPNLIFIGGLGLIVASGFSSHRIQDIFGDALRPAAALQNNPTRLWRSLKIIGVQLIWVFGVTLLSRLSAGFANFMLVVIIGIWILWLMRNPEIFILLNAISQDESTTPTPSGNTISALAAQLNSSQLVNSNLYPGSLFPQNPNTTQPQTPQSPNPLAPNSIYQNVLNSLRGSGGGSRGIK